MKTVRAEKPAGTQNQEEGKYVLRRKPGKRRKKRERQRKTVKVETYKIMRKKRTCPGVIGEEEIGKRSLVRAGIR